MAYLLHIETTSTVCSVAISLNDELIVLKELNNGYTHAENLHVFINDTLNQASLHLQQLSAISISAGPGSYTGLRIGFSSAKGMAYALKIPLIVVPTLQALTSIAIKKIEAELYCPLLDARRMEVYYGIFDFELKEVNPILPLVLDENSIEIFRKKKSMCFFGDGMPKAKDLLQTLPHKSFLEDVMPSASALISLAYQKFINKQFSDVAYAGPFYLKEFFFTSTKK